MTGYISTITFLRTCIASKCGCTHGTHPSLFAGTAPRRKRKGEVIIEKSHSEASQMEQDATRKFKVFIQNFDTSKCAANYVISFEVHDGFICQKILKL